MRLRSRLFLFFAVIFILPLLANGQQYVMVLNENGAPLEDAVINYQLPGGVRKTILTNSEGKAGIIAEADVVLGISKLGYHIFMDTLPKGTSRTYNLKQNGLNLKDVVVTGQFDAVTTDKSVQKMRVIDRKRIDQQGAVSLKDLLTNELNVRLSQDAVLGTQMSMMGIGGQNVKILIDGVPVIGRLDGNLDISQINLNNIEKVEITEGPMSVIYGTDALGGAINLITKKPAGKQLSAGVNTYYETVGTYNADFNAGLRHKGFRLTLSGGRNFFDGYSENEDPKLRWMQWKPKEQYFGDVQAEYKFKNQSHRIYSQYFQEKITSRNSPNVLPYSVTGFDDYFNTVRLTNSLYSDFRFNNNATFSLINSYSIYERRKNTYVKNLVTGESQPTSDPEDQDTTRFDLLLLRGTYTTRTKSIFNSQMGYDINIESGEGKKLENNRQQIADVAGFYICEIKPVEKLTLKQGLRFIYNSRYKAPVIPSISVKYDLMKDLSVRASYSEGFRSPSLKELALYFVDVNHFILGNPNLKAETSNNYSASVSYSKPIRKAMLKLDGTLFYTDVKDMISLAIVDSASQLYSYINIDVFRTHGLNLSADLSVADFTMNFGYARTGRYNQLTGASGVPDYSYADEYRCNLSYSAKKLGLDGSIFYKYNGALPGYALDANDQPYRTQIAAYAMLDASVTKSFAGNRIRLSVGAKNIGDVKNISMNAVSSSAHSSGSGSMPVSMGRYFFTSLKLSIGKS